MVILVNLTPVQNFLSRQATSWLSEKLRTKVALQHVRFDILNKVSLEGLYIEDRSGDTLLYAGQVQVKITDWFIFKDRPVISYIGLKKTYANLYRNPNSETWNYQFIIDAFSTGKQDTTVKGSSKKTEFDIRNIDLEHIRFHMVDKWVGSDMIGEVRDFGINARGIDFDKKTIDIRSVDGDGVTFGLRDYKGGRPARSGQTTLAEIDSTPFNPGLWKVSLGKISLKNSRFFLQDPDYKPAVGAFDPMQMDITGINLDARDIAVTGDTLLGKLEMLQAKERCGIEIRKMSAMVTVSPNIAECRNLYLQTNNSVLRDYYAMHYRRFPDFEDYITNVVMEGRLSGSEVAVNDIAFFAPALKQWDNIRLKVSGQANGTVSDLKAKNLYIHDGISWLKGNVSMKGLPEIDETVIALDNGEISTSAAGAFLYAPELKHEKSVDITAVGDLYFKGSFLGLWNDFAAKGNIMTGLGNVAADAKLKFPANGNPLYAGTVSTGNFELGKLLNEDIIGAVSFDTKISGNGFDPVLSSITIDGKANYIDLYGYSYHNITIAGDLKNKLFNGKLDIKDTSLTLNFDGKVNFEKEHPSFDLVAAIDHLNARAIGLTDENITASGNVVLNFSGSTIDDFVGDAYIEKLDIYRDSTRLNIDSLRLSSRMEGRRKELVFGSNNLAGSVRGEFSILDLPSSIQLFLSYYLPQYVTQPEKINADQNLVFELSTGNTDDLVSLFSKKLRIASGSKFTGSLNMWDQQMQFAGNLPFVNYGGIQFNNIEISSDGNYSGFHLLTTVNGIKNGTSDLASTVQFETSIFQDSARFELLTTTPTSLAKAQVSGVAYAYNDSFYLKILPSEFYLNENRWEIPSGNAIRFAKDYLDIDNFTIRSGTQEINISSARRDNDNTMLATIRNLDVAPLFAFSGMDDMTLEGRLDGTLELASALKDQVVLFDLSTGQLNLNNDTIGSLSVAGRYEAKKSLITLLPESGLSYKDAKLSASGTLSLDPGSTENIDGKIVFDNALLAWTQPLLYGFVHKISGTVNGEISIRGKADQPRTTGTIRLENAGFIPDITGVHYNIAEGDIAVTDTKFDVGNMTVTDDLGNEALLTGSISHKQLADMNLRLRMNSDNIQVLNLKDFEGQNFYGNVMSSVQMRINGRFDDLRMNISATPRKGSHLYIPVSMAGDLSEYDYIHFKQYGEEVAAYKPQNRNKLNITIDAIATPDLECTIILDAGTGDQISAKGAGNIILEIPAVGNMRLNGNYIIDEGKYDFSFKQLQVLNYKRQFIINSGSAIKWNGDISDADLDVTAYTQIKARLYDLIMNDVDRVALSNGEIRDAQLMQMVNVQMNMQGSLSAPKFNFKIDLAENRSIGTYAFQKLQRINTDDKELLNQVAALLLLEQFIPPEGFNSSAAVSTGTINNMSELASTFASSQITNFTNKVLGMQDLYVGVRYKNYNLANGNNSFDQLNVINRNEAGINLRKNFFNNRLIVDVGGVYDWGRTSATQNTITDNLAGDFRVQYLLTEDGRIRFNIFRTSNYDAIFQQNIARNGVGLTYRKSFNGIRDFFQSEASAKKARHMEQQKRNGVDSTGMPVPAATGKPAGASNDPDS